MAGPLYSGMLTHTTAGKAVLGPWLPRPRGRSLSDGAEGDCPRCEALTAGWPKKGMSKKPKARLDVWAEAQRRFHLSDLHIQMARELGLNPKQCGGLANHRQEP